MTYRGFTSICALACALAAFAASPARADRVAVMVPPRTDQTPSGEAGEAASEELARLLRWDSFNVISPGQAGAAAEGQQKSGAFSRNFDPMFCITPECAEEYRKLFDGLFAVQLALNSKSGRLLNVTVVLTEGVKAFYSASAPVEGNDVREATREAYGQAREKQRLGAGPWLSVTGYPERATVYLDKVEFGHLPVQKRRLAAGPHQLEVRAEQYVSDVRTINVPGNIDHHETVVVALRRAEELPRSELDAPRSRIRRSPWDWAVGGVVAAVGAAHLAAGIYQKTREGDCADRNNGVCTEVYGSGGGVKRDNLLIGLGAAGVAAGGLIMGLGPIGTLSMRADKQSALLELKGKF
ncbi:MAG TPA: PEGA domain-containing protein [Polyangiales bacterium]|nr:PEGA domain-containing protein [Polyangiales bacterium]